MHHHGEKKYDLKYRIITTSSTRNFEGDESGKYLENLFREDGAKVERIVVKDSFIEILHSLSENFDEFDVFIFSGGTGLSKFDLTSRTLRKVADKEIRGFGEVFRKESEDQAGIYSYLSDASMFVVENKPVFAVPGSLKAQDIVFNLIRKFINHVYFELNKE